MSLEKEFKVFDDCDEINLNEMFFFFFVDQVGDTNTFKIGMIITIYIGIGTFKMQ